MHHLPRLAVRRDEGRTQRLVALDEWANAVQGGATERARQTDAAGCCRRPMRPAAGSAPTASLRGGKFVVVQRRQRRNRIHRLRAQERQYLRLPAANRVRHFRAQDALGCPQLELVALHPQRNAAPMQIRQECLDGGGHSSCSTSRSARREVGVVASWRADCRISSTRAARRAVG